MKLTPAQKGTFASLSVNGFTLIEVIIAMILLTVGLLTLFSVITSGLVQSGVTREYDVARNAANAKIEEIRGVNFSDIVSVYSATDFAVVGLVTPTGWANPGYISVNDSAADLYDITITIRWQIQGNPNAAVYNEYITRSLMTRRYKY